MYALPSAVESRLGLSERLCHLAVSQLFNVEEDPFEMTNIAAANPIIVSNMTATLEQVRLALTDPYLHHD